MLGGTVYRLDRNTHFYISPTKGITIRGSHGIESGYEFSEEFEKNVQLLFSNTKFALIYDGGEGSPVVFEAEVSHSFSFNGIVLTNDNEEPMYGFIEETKCQEIETNVFYFEGQ